MNSKIFIAALIIILVSVVSLIAGLYLTNQTDTNPQTSPTPQVSPSRQPTSTLTILPTPTAAAEPTFPTIGYYLPLNNGSLSQIFLISANASYGYYPGSSRIVLNSEQVENGETCYTINLTVRNDYSPQNPPPNYHPNPNIELYSNYAFVSFRANVYNGQVKLNVTDLNTVGLPPQAGFHQIAFGESETIHVYLKTNNTEITSFQILPVWVSGIPTIGQSVS